MKKSNKLPLSDQERTAKRLEGLRLEKHWSKEDVANQIGVTRKTYHEWESGKTIIEKNTGKNLFYYPSITSDNLFALSDLYNVSIDYLLGRSDFRSPEREYIGMQTGLSDSAIAALEILHFPAHKGEIDSLQTGRYDIIALNIILENFYNNYKNSNPQFAFSAENETILNCVGKYIDSGSASTSLIQQNNNTNVIDSSNIAKYSADKDLHICLDELHKKYSLLIRQRIHENNEYFNSLYKEHIRQLLSNNMMEDD